MADEKRVEVVVVDGDPFHIHITGPEIDAETLTEMVKRRVEEQGKDALWKCREIRLFWDANRGPSGIWIWQFVPRRRVW